MSSSDDLQSTDDGSGHDTAVFPVDLDDEGETPSGAAEAEMWAEEVAQRLGAACRQTRA